MSSLIDLAGQRFGSLVVQGLHSTDGKHTKWMCRCDCGGEIAIFRGSLVRGITTHCGCKRSERLSAGHTKHGMAGTRLYKVWAAMKDRCHNPRNEHYADYGGRGISVCDSWRTSFAEFLNDMGLPPSAKHTIERVDNNRGYDPSNCVWATRAQQQRNRRVNRVLTVDGQSKCVTEWAEVVGINRNVIHGRLSRGWNAERAVKTPRLNQGRKDLNGAST